MIKVPNFSAPSLALIINSPLKKTSLRQSVRLIDPEINKPVYSPKLWPIQKVFYLFLWLKSTLFSPYKHSRYWEISNKGCVYFVMFIKLFWSVVAISKRLTPNLSLYFSNKAFAWGFYKNLSNMPFSWFPWPPKSKTSFLVLNLYIVMLFIVDWGKKHVLRGQNIFCKIILILKPKLLLILQKIEFLYT